MTILTFIHFRGFTVPECEAAGMVQVCDHVGGRSRRVPPPRAGRGGPPLGRPEEQAEHELRQAQPRPQVNTTGTTVIILFDGLAMP